MAEVSAGARDYPEPVVSWLAGGRARFIVAMLALAAFYSVCWHLARVDPGKLLTGLPRMASWVGKAWPPATDELPVLLLRAAETVAMAALGTTGAALLALPLAVLPHVCSATPRTPANGPRPTAATKSSANTNESIPRSALRNQRVG